MAYTNSSMVVYTKLSPNHSGQRTHGIDRITPHCVVGQCSVETLGSIFAPCILSSKNPWFCQSKFLGIATGIPW